MEQKKKRLLRPFDGWILLALLLVACSPFVIRYASAQGAQKEAVLFVDGKEKVRFSLEKQAEPIRYPFSQGEETQVLEIKDGRARIKEANCPNQRCVQTGWIDKSGEQIFCLPHHVLVEVQSTGGNTHAFVD